MFYNNNVFTLKFVSIGPNISVLNKLGLLLMDIGEIFPMQSPEFTIPPGKKIESNMKITAIKIKKNSPKKGFLYIKKYIF